MYNDKMVKAIYNSPIILGHMLGYDKLTSIHDDWIKWLWLSDKDNYLQAHRGSYKTSAVIVLGVIWRLLFNPNLRIALIRKSETGAQATLGEIIKQYESESMQYVYSEYFDYKLKLTNYNKSMLNLPNKEKISKESTIDTYGKGGSITGFHYDVLLVDDIITMKDRYSKAERESTKAYVHELQSIKEATGKRIFTNTPWHIDDASTIMPEPQKYPIGSINIPEVNSPENIKELQKLPASLYACNYLLKHIADEKSLFPDIKFKKWNERLLCKSWLDPAWGGICTTGLTLIQEQGNDLVVKGFVWPKHITDIKNEITTILNSNNSIDQMYEKNGVDPKRKQEIESTSSSMYGVMANDNKHYRIMFYIKKFMDRIYFADDCQIEYLEQIRLYEEGGVPNEAPDSLASLLRESYDKLTNTIQKIKTKDFYNEFQY